jgi:hypothetical protein
MTVLGVIFIPAVLICFFWRPFFLLPLLVIASIFEAGAVFNGRLGEFNFGITPFYLTEVLIFLQVIMLGFGGEPLLPSKNARVRGIVLVLCAFWVWCLVSAVVMPHLFSGTMVSAPRNEMDEDFAPLQWTLSNLAQAAYLTLNLGTVLYALHVVRSQRQAERLTKALYWAILLVVVVGFAQFLAAKAGLDFPYELFNNNSGYQQGTEQELGSIRRINCTFMEPSMAGSFLAAATCGLVAAFLNGKRNLGWLLTIFTVMTALLLTTSTTGLATLIVGGGLLMVYFKFFGAQQHARKSSVLGWAVTLAILGILGYVLFSNPDFLDALLAATVEKSESYSYYSRLAKELHSVELFVNTYGLGVGFGSNRSSGLLTTLLSSVGIIGTVLFTMMLYRIGRLYPGHSAPKSLQVGFWALLTLTVSEIIGVPDVNRPVLLLIVLTQLNTHFDPRPALEPAEIAKTMTLRSSFRRSSGVAPTN